MQDKHLYEYAVVRVVPHVEREEFINVGVVLYCGRRKFLQVCFHLDEAKVHALCAKTDVDNIKHYLASFEKICNAAKDGGPIAQLPPAERFRWLTATRSTVVQCSKVHPGYCTDPEQKLQQLFTQLVL